MVVGVVSSIMATVSSGAQVASSMSCMLDVFYHPAIGLLKDTSIIDDPKWDCKVLAPFSVRSQPNSFHNPVHRFIAGVMCSLFTLQVTHVVSHHIQTLLCSIMFLPHACIQELTIAHSARKCSCCLSACWLSSHKAPGCS